MTGQHDDAAGRTRRGATAFTETEQALVARLQAMSTELAVTPDEEFRAATRSRLMAMAAVRTPAAETAGRRPAVPAGALHRLLAGNAGPYSRWRTRLTAGLAGAALTVTAVGGLLAAAQGAHPGDLLYDLKRGGEQTQLALAGDSRGVTLLEFASTRLDELGDLVGVDPNADAVVGATPSGGEAGLAAGPDVGLVLDTLQTMDEQTTEGTAALTTRAVERSDTAALHTLTGWAGDQQSGLGAVAGAVPTGAQGALAGSRDLVDQVAARGAALEQVLTCPGGPSTAGADKLGPLPATCPAGPPATAGAPPSGASVSGSPSGSAPATSSAAPGTASPGATTGGGPSTAVPVVPPGGGAPPTTAAPATSAKPGLPLPTLPALPGGRTTSSAPSSSGGALVPVSPVLPGVCAPPLLGC